MVDLAKIRKKAKKKPESRQPVTDNAPQAPEKKLEKFLAQAGSRRFVPQMPVVPSAEQIELLTFMLGRERYAIGIDHVAQIIAARPSTPVPNAAEGIVGIISLRGSIVTLLDVRSKLRQSPRSDRSDPRVIVIEEEGGLVGFEVDRVLRPAKFDRSAIEPQPVTQSDEQSECILGVIRGEGSLTIVLDLVKLLASRPL